jgi:ankyrin repeat protein
MLSSSGRISAVEGKQQRINRLLVENESSFYRDHELTDGSFVTFTRNADLTRQSAIIEIINSENDGGPIEDDKWSQNLLHSCIIMGYSEIVRVLIEKDINVNSCDSSNKTFLHLALEAKNNDIVRYLIDARADVNAKSTGNQVPLHFAVQKNATDNVKYLINARADVNAKSTEGKTPLHFAVINSNKEITQDLIEAGADVTTKTKEGENLIHIVVKGTNYENDILDLYSSMVVIEKLIEAGVDINERTNKGETAYSIASRSILPDMAEYIKNLPQFVSPIKQEPRVGAVEVKQESGVGGESYDGSKKSKPNSKVIIVGVKNSDPKVNTKGSEGRP